MNKATTPSNDLKFDHKKPRMSIAPLDCLDQVAWVATYGAEKYAPRSWQQVKNGEERYCDAMLRHAVAHASGEILDPETGLPHMAQVAWNALAVLWFMRERGALPATYDFSGVRAKFEAERKAAEPFANGESVTPFSGKLELRNPRAG